MKYLFLILAVVISTQTFAQDNPSGEWQQPANTPVSGPCHKCKPNEKFEKNVYTPPVERDDKSDSIAKKGS